MSSTDNDVLTKTAVATGAKEKTVQRARAYKKAIDEHPDLNEEAQNLNAIRNFLKKINRLESERMKSKRTDGRGGRLDEAGSIRNIALIITFLFSFTDENLKNIQKIYI